MEGRALDPYEQQLFAVFESCDEGQVGSLDSNGLEQLCEKLQLEEQGLELIECLLGGSKTGKRVTFSEFRDGLLALLDEGQKKGESGGRGSPEREVSPKFVFGKKKYGRRSRPESTDQDVELDAILEDSDSEIFIPVGGESKEIIMRAVCECPNDEAQHPKKRKTNEDENQSINSSTSSLDSKQPSICHQSPASGWPMSSEPAEPCEGSAPPSLGSEEECLRAAWERLGVGRDGFLDRKELALVCQCIGMERVSEEVVQQLFEKLDVDRDGRISFEEFLLLFRSGGSLPSPASPSQKGSAQSRRRDFARSSVSDDRQPLSLDHNSMGLVSVDVIVETWEAAGVPKASRLLQDLGFGDVQQVGIAEVSAILEEELHGLEEERRNRDPGTAASASWTPHETLLQATLALYQTEVRCLKSTLEHMGAERDKLRADIADANERAALLAQEVDDHHARLEESSQLQVKLLEQRHAEQVRQVTEQLGLEREQLALQIQTLEKKVLALQDDESHIRNELVTLQSENEAVDKENQSLLEQLTESNQFRAQMQEEVESMARLQQRLSELEGSREQEQVLPLLEKMGELQAENTGLRDRIDELTVEMEAMGARLSATKMKKSASVQVSPDVSEESGASGGATKRRGDSPLALPLEESSEEESPRLGKVRRCCKGSCQEEVLDAVNMEGLQIHPLTHGESGVEADLEVDESESLYSDPGFRERETENHCCNKWPTESSPILACENKKEVARLRLRVAKLEQDLKRQSDNLSACEVERERLQKKESKSCCCGSEQLVETPKSVTQMKQLIHKQALQELMEDGDNMSSLQEQNMSQRHDREVEDEEDDLLKVTGLALYNTSALSKIPSTANGLIPEAPDNTKDVEQLEQHCRDLKFKLDHIKVEIVKILSEKDACSKENCALKIHISDLKNRQPTGDSDSFQEGVAKSNDCEYGSGCGISKLDVVDNCVNISDSVESIPDVTKGNVNLFIVSKDTNSRKTDKDFSTGVFDIKLAELTSGRAAQESSFLQSRVDACCPRGNVKELPNCDVQARYVIRSGEDQLLCWRCKTEDSPPSIDVQSLQVEVETLMSRLTQAEERAAKESERCSELEASLELLRQEYEKCEDYWASKLEEERHIYDQEQRLSDEKFSEVMSKIREYEDVCGVGVQDNCSEDSNDRLSTIEERASLEKQVTDLEEECEELRTRSELEQAERDEELTQLRERLTAMEQRNHFAGGKLDVAVQVSDLENGSWESDRTFVVELDGARKASRKTKDSSRTNKSNGRLAGLANGYGGSGSSSPDAVEVRRLQELKGQLDEDCQNLMQQKEALVQNGMGIPFSFPAQWPKGKAGGQACRVDLSVLQALNARLRQQEQRCKQLQHTLKQQQQHMDTLLQQTWHQHKEEVTDLKSVLQTTQERLLQQTSACKDQTDRLARTDMLVKELYVENAYLVATVQRLEQRCHVLVQMTSDSSSV